MTKQAPILITLSLLALLGIMACNDAAPPAVQSTVVKQKITAQPAPNEKPDPKVPENNTEKQNTGIENPVPAQARGDENVPPVSTADLIEETQIAANYEPTGRFDPFEPLFKDEPTAEVRVAGKESRQRRAPQTPLERVGLSQLKLSAIIRAPSGNRGLVVDATGKGYIVEIGTYMGLNSGKVTQINKDCIVVEEDIEDIMGEIKIQHSELKLQKPAGEL